MKNLTIVFNYEGEKPKLAVECLQAFAKKEQSITAASHEDEMARMEYFEHLLEEECIYWDEVDYQEWLEEQRGES